QDIARVVEHLCLDVLVADCARPAVDANSDLVDGLAVVSRHGLRLTLSCQGVGWRRSLLIYGFAVPYFTVPNLGRHTLSAPSSGSDERMASHRDKQER